MLDPDDLLADDVQHRIGQQVVGLVDGARQGVLDRQTGVVAVARDRRGDQSPSTKIFNLIRGMRDSGAAATGEGQGELDMRRVRERVLAKGFTAQQLEACLDEYAQLDVSLFFPCDGMFLCLRLLTIHLADLANGSGRHSPCLHRGWRRRVRRRRILRWTTAGAGGVRVIYCSIGFRYLSGLTFSCMRQRSSLKPIELIALHDNNTS